MLEVLVRCHIPFALDGRGVARISRKDRVYLLIVLLDASEKDCQVDVQAVYDRFHLVALT